VEQFGAGSRTEGVEAFTQLLLEFIRTHVNRRLRRRPGKLRREPSMSGEGATRSTSVVRSGSCEPRPSLLSGRTERLELI
jgi:hypothetical protein